MENVFTYGMRLIVDVTIGNFNWYVVMLMFMMILIWDDVVNKDYVNMNWWYCWWLCEYEMRSLLCWQRHWDEMMSMLRMMWKWNVDCYWKCFGMCMLCMFVEGEVHWPSKVFDTCFGSCSYDGCCVCSWGVKCTDLPCSLALALGHVHTSYVVYVHGG